MTEMTGAQAVGKAILAENVRTVFTLADGSILPILDVLIDNGVKVVDVIIYGVLRKELTVELLFVLANGPLDAFMTMRQMVVFALVTTIYIPCIATLAVLGREYSWKYTAVLATTTITLAFLLGGVANWLLLGLGFP